MREIFCVVYDVTPSKLKARKLEISKFWITNVPYDIIDELNHYRNWHRHRAFNSFYEAVSYAYGLLALEDRFIWNLNSSVDICLNHVYAKEEKK